MITIQSPLGDVVVRADRTDIDQVLSQAPVLAPSGVIVMVGDAGWSPASLTLRCRVVDTSAADAVAAWRSLVAAAKTATGLVLHDSTVDVQGVRSVRSVPRGTWWDVTLTFLPLRLEGVRGTTPAAVSTPPYMLAGIGTYLAFDTGGSPLVWTEE